jgi:hypothetical protein
MNNQNKVPIIFVLCMNKLVETIVVIFIETTAWLCYECLINSLFGNAKIMKQLKSGKNECQWRKTSEHYSTC